LTCDAVTKVLKAAVQSAWPRCCRFLDDGRSSSAVPAPRIAGLLAAALDTEQRIVDWLLELPRIENLLVLEVQQGRQALALMLEHVFAALAQSVEEERTALQRVHLVVPGVTKDRGRAAGRPGIGRRLPAAPLRSACCRAAGRAGRLSRSREAP
jgi:hypothetical protein